MYSRMLRSESEAAKDGCFEWCSSNIGGDMLVVFIVKQAPTRTDLTTPLQHSYSKTRSLDAYSPRSSPLDGPVFYGLLH